MRSGEGYEKKTGEKISLSRTLMFEQQHLESWEGYLQGKTETEGKPGKEEQYKYLTIDIVYYSSRLTTRKRYAAIALKTNIEVCLFVCSFISFTW